MADLDPPGCFPLQIGKLAEIAFLLRQYALLIDHCHEPGPSDPLDCGDLLMRLAGQLDAVIGELLDPCAAGRAGEGARLDG
ncbi:hypothetical protein [Chitinimonas koreensis]|uniref:hypothetical protein n=1 Tax=Chitinimonas koreensis TaxID=356302 RepID=UPI00040596BE|nr:hypothetical protein [Chitinimonas koreensis]QNM98194.1 hypothetical protein H9L41_08110 [Chitinimonas koreensis]